MDFDSWEKFEKLLYNLSKQSGFKPRKGEYSNRTPSPLISPATYAEGTTRANKNVTEWSGWCALDIDDYEGSFEDALITFENIRYVCYSSASSTKTHPKFRVVIPLTKPVEAKKIRHFWAALNSEFNKLGDPQTKDLSRMYYVPAQYEGSDNQFIFTHDGHFLDPDALMARHPWIATRDTFASMLDDKTKARLAAYRKESLTDTSFRWTSWRDCPFVNKKMVDEYRACTENWYHMMYRLMMSIASRATLMKYPITATEIETLCREIDNETGRWYENRPIKLESERALAFAIGGNI